MATEEKKVKGRDDVVIEYTEKAKFHKAGDKDVVHRIQAEKLVEKGVAKLSKGK